MRLLVGSDIGAIRAIRIEKKHVERWPDPFPLSPANEIQLLRWRDPEELEVCVSSGKQLAICDGTTGIVKRRYQAPFAGNLRCVGLHPLLRSPSEIVVTYEDGSVFLLNDEFQTSEENTDNTPPNDTEERWKRLIKVETAVTGCVKKRNGATERDKCSVQKARVEPTAEDKFALTGNEVLLQLYDLNTNQKIWTAKNVPHDDVNLRLPYWETDLSFFPNDPNRIMTTTAFHQVRIYDVRTQRRPIKTFEAGDGKLTSLHLPAGGAYAFFGDGKGHLWRLCVTDDVHRMGKLPGCMGSIKGLEYHQQSQLVAAVSADRFLRLYRPNNATFFKQFLKNRGSAVLFSKEELTNRRVAATKAVKEEQEDEEEDQEELEDLWARLPDVGDQKAGSLKRKLSSPQKPQPKKPENKVQEAADQDSEPEDDDDDDDDDSEHLDGEESDDDDDDDDEEHEQQPNKKKKLTSAEPSPPKHSRLNPSLPKPKQTKQTKNKNKNQTKQAKNKPKQTKKQ